VSDILPYGINVQETKHNDGENEEQLTLGTAHINHHSRCFIKEILYLLSHSNNYVPFRVLVRVVLRIDNKTAILCVLVA